MGLLNQVDILAWALPGKAENTLNYIEIVEEYIQDVDKPGFRQFRRAQTQKFHVESEPFFGHLLNQTWIGLTKPGRHFGLGASRKSRKHLELH